MCGKVITFPSLLSSEFSFFPFTDHTPSRSNPNNINPNLPSSSLFTSSISIRSWTTITLPPMKIIITPIKTLKKKIPSVNSTKTPTILFSCPLLLLPLLRFLPSTFSFSFKPFFFRRFIYM